MKKTLTDNSENHGKPPHTAVRFFAIGLIGEDTTRWRWWLLWGLIGVLAVAMRLVQGPQHYIWDFDQARDSFASQRVIVDKDIILVGPQAEIYGMFHGPLFYYFVAPWYVAGHGSPYITLLAMIALNVATLVPLGLLTHSLFKSRRMTTAALVFFALAYEQIGYARWISNVSITIPFLVTTYYLLWRHVDQGARAWWTSLGLGLALGLAVQGQLFLLYFIPICLLVMYLNKSEWWRYILFGGGLAVALAPQALFEIKYGFQGSKIFIDQFLVQTGKAPLLASDVLMTYIDHLGMTAKHAVTGFSDGLGLLGLVVSLAYVVWQWPSWRTRHQQAVAFVVLLVFSHVLVVPFHFVDAVFLDLGIGIALQLLAVVVLHGLWRQGYRLVVVGAVVVLVGLQMGQLAKFTATYTPFSYYNFAQQGVMMEQKLHVVDQLYQQAQGRPFSIGVLGNPYGVRTVWASVFAEYRRLHPEVSFKPGWYGYVANGYPGEAYFTPQDHPEELHFLLVEATPELHSPYIWQEYMNTVNEATRLVSSTKIFGIEVQTREATHYDQDANVEFSRL